MATIVRWTGIESRALRDALRLSVRDFANKLGVQPRTVSAWEHDGSDSRISHACRGYLDTMLDRADDSATTRFERSLAASGQQDVPDTELTPPEFEVGLTPKPAGYSDTFTDSRRVDDDFESPVEIVTRIQKFSQIGAHGAAIDVIEVGVEDIVNRYELEGPKRLAPEAIALRRKVDEIASAQHDPSQLRRIHILSSKLSGMLGYMAANRGRFRHSQMYCREAFEIANILDDNNIKAWIKGTQSFCAYYMCDFAGAARLAEEGQAQMRGVATVVVA